MVVGDVKELNKQTVEELKEACRARGLSDDGKKYTLVLRLKTALEADSGENAAAANQPKEASGAAADQLPAPSPSSEKEQQVEVWAPQPKASPVQAGGENKPSWLEGEDGDPEARSKGFGAVAKKKPAPSSVPETAPWAKAPEPSAWTSAPAPVWTTGPPPSHQMAPPAGHDGMASTWDAQAPPYGSDSYARRLPMPPTQDSMDYPGWGSRPWSAPPEVHSGAGDSQATPGYWSQEDPEKLKLVEKLCPPDIQRRLLDWWKRSLSEKEAEEKRRELIPTRERHTRILDAVKEGLQKAKVREVVRATKAAIADLEQVSQQLVKDLEESLIATAKVLDEHKGSLASIGVLVADAELENAELGVESSREIRKKLYDEIWSDGVDLRKILRGLELVREVPEHLRSVEQAVRDLLNDQPERPPERSPGRQRSRDRHRSLSYERRRGNNGRRGSPRRGRRDSRSRERGRGRRDAPRDYGRRSRSRSRGGKGRKGGKGGGRSPYGRR